MLQRRVRPPKKKYELGRKIWNDKITYHSLINSVYNTQFCTLLSATTEFALAAIRGMTLLNGGGAVAILSFMATKTIPKGVDILTSLKCFAWGALLSVFVASTSYLCQLAFTRSAGREWSAALEKDECKRCKHTTLHKIYDIIGFILQVVSCVGGLVSLILFYNGCMSAYATLAAVQ